MVIGALDSWGPSTVFSTVRDSDKPSSTWSPCGHFIATVSHTTVKIQDALALSTLSTLKLTTNVGNGCHRKLAYSPDGHSLACCFDTAIVIWDTQTGGEVRAIKHGLTGDYANLVWSLDGKMLGTTLFTTSEYLTAHVYEVASGTVQSSGPVQSTTIKSLWAHNKSFRLMTTSRHNNQSTINIYEVGSTLTMAEQYHLPRGTPGVFSHATYRISVANEGISGMDLPWRLIVLDIRNLAVLLQEKDFHNGISFSPDGNLLAASNYPENKLIIWKYTSGQYTWWREFQQPSASMQFSPTLSSILGHAGALLHVFHLDSPAALTVESGITTRSIPLDACCPHGVYIAATHRGESVITITNLCSQNPSPSQSIDTGVAISFIILTGNVLLVEGMASGRFCQFTMSSDIIVAWLLTEEGAVGGILDKRRADRSDSLWDMPLSGDYRLRRPELFVEGEIAALRWGGDSLRVYQTKTGEILKSDDTPQGTVYRFRSPHRDYCKICCHDPHKHHEPPERNWPVSRATLQEGWVKDLEGKHRLWLPPSWRTNVDDVDWLGRVTTLRLKRWGEVLVVKF